MKSNNKLQYLQKLASKNQQQQNPGSKKLSQSNNLVGIGQSASNPYVQGPRFGQKQVKHQPKNTASSELPVMHASQSQKKFTQKSKSQSKSSIVMSREYYSATMEIKDPRMDQFDENKIDQDVFEDLSLRRKNRKRQMNRRRQKLNKRVENGILKNNNPMIKLEMMDDQSEERKQFRKQVSISEEPRIGGSPGIKIDPKNKHQARKLNRGASDERSRDSLQIGHNPKSELTISDAGKHPDDQDNNSIISEEDSAFEDQTPAQKKSKDAQITNFTNAQVHVERKEHSHSRISNKNDEAVVANMKAYNRQKTHGWKQNKHDVTRWPFQRSPTHKSRNGNGDVDSSGSKNKFVLKVVPSGIKKPKEKGFTQQSRHSSLNYTMDNQIDQLSVNMNKNLMFAKGKEPVINGNTSNMESQSVASIITKGGTVINPFGQKKNSNHFMLAKSQSKNSATMKTARGLKKDTNFMTGEQNIDLKGDASKTHVRFGTDIDEEDVRKSYHKNNQKMINIYLKTPYKVLTIDQIKNKEKMDRERDLVDAVNPSPSRLYLAENNLKIHTMLGEKNKYATAKGGKFKKSLIYVSGDEEDTYDVSRQNRKTGFSTSNKKKLFNDQSISQISDVMDKVEYNESAQHLDSQDMLSDNNLIQLTSSQLKQLKNQKTKLEIEFKKKFYNQLQNQLEKRIEQVKFQTNALAKQKHLFTIYGNTTSGISPDVQRSILNNLSIDTIQQGIDLDDLGTSNDKKFKLLQAQQNQFKHNTATKQNESQLSRVESPSKLDSVAGNSVLKGSISRQQEPPLVKQSTNVSKYSRLSENEFGTKEEPINEQDQLEEDEDEREVRVTGMSYDFEQDASLKKLLSMSNTLGYSQVQIRDLRKKQKQLEQAEKKLQIQRGQEMISRNAPNNTSGSFVINKVNIEKNHQPKKLPPKFVSHTRSRTDKKPLRRDKLSMIQEKESMVRAIEAENASNDENVKDYFDNKISLRRSIEKKLHYESKISQTKAAGHNYPTSAQKHQQLLADLKNLKKERADAYHSKNMDQSSYADTTPGKAHHRMKTHQGSLKQDTTLPEIHNNHYAGESVGSLRKLKSNVKDDKINNSPLESETFYPLKKSGTQNEKKKNMDVGFSPIRMKRNNVIMAYNIQTQNPVYGSLGPINNTDLRNNSSKKQLGFQFMNKSPRPSVLSTGMHKDPSFSFEKESPQKMTNTGKFITAKQTQLMKGVLSNQNGRKNRVGIKNKDLMHVNEASQGRLPSINQSSSYAPGQ